ncbi:hypothetical protein HMPREF1619_02091 [Klebsiella pneumoniae 909957]|nr:hypothetical protein HMPREF1619_02091 [Klebsiella pneumoniae 909957]
MSCCKVSLLSPTSRFKGRLIGLFFFASLANGLRFSLKLL